MKQKQANIIGVILISIIYYFFFWDWIVISDMTYYIPANVIENTISDIDRAIKFINLSIKTEQLITGLIYLSSHFFIWKYRNKLGNIIMSIFNKF